MAKTLSKHGRAFERVYSHFGADTYGHDVKAFGDTTGKYFMWDASANTFYVSGTLDLDGAVTVGVDDTGYDVTFFGATSGKKFFWDESADTAYLTCTVDIDGTVTVGVDDTGYDVKFFGATASAYMLWDESDDALELAGTARIDLSGCTVAAANTDGGVIKAGTSGAKVTEDTADTKFVSMYWDCGATSGDSRGIYNRLYITGAGGGGESLRSFTTVEDVAAATAHGSHVSLSFGSTGSLTGLGVASRSTLHVANQAYTGLGGTYAAIQPEIWADGSTTDSVGMTELSLIRCVLGGNATGLADIDDDAFLIVLDGGAIAGGNIVEASTTEANYAYSARCKLNGTTAYLMFASAVG